MDFKSLLFDIVTFVFAVVGLATGALAMML